MDRTVEQTTAPPPPEVAPASEARPALFAERRHRDEDPVEAARRAARALASAVLTARHVETAEHSDDVVGLCEAIADEMGLRGPDREQLLAAAQLHDVGKLAIPHEILEKPGPLDDGEWAVMHQHTVIGERILKSVPEMAEVATIVRHAHERWAGDGYPDRLAGDRIPMASRIILCADAFHAIRSDRPYRTSRSSAEAVAEIRANAGTQFDPRVVEALLAVSGDVRRGRSMHRRLSPRVMALLLTLALGGTAFAAFPPLRHAVESAVGLRHHAHTSSPALPQPAADGSRLASCAGLALEGHPCSAQIAALGPIALRVVPTGAIRRAHADSRSVTPASAGASRSGRSSALAPTVVLPPTSSVIGTANGNPGATGNGAGALVAVPTQPSAAASPPTSPTRADSGGQRGKSTASVSDSNSGQSTSAGTTKSAAGTQGSGSTGLTDGQSSGGPGQGLSGDTGSGSSGGSDHGTGGGQGSGGQGNSGQGQGNSAQGQGNSGQGDGSPGQGQGQGQANGGNAGEGQPSGQGGQSGDQGNAGGAGQGGSGDQGQSGGNAGYSGGNGGGNGGGTSGAAHGGHG